MAQQQQQLKNSTCGSFQKQAAYQMIAPKPKDYLLTNYARSTMRKGKKKDSVKIAKNMQGKRAREEKRGRSVQSPLK